ncbi:MAG TPA: GAF domain-containing protein [Candidatus Polarisedimenticolia bacterium]|jgi:signal transduction histidine kinase|nr:GAF domain-containing protein [Candidatus Polarisedimenticolia bacterium]
MSEPQFNANTGFALLGELARLTAPPADSDEICDQGLALIAKALGAQAALGFETAEPSPALRLTCRWGRPSSEDLGALAERTASLGELTEEKGPGGTSSRRVAIPIADEAGVMGVMVLEAPARWNATARLFVQSAARTLGAALRVQRMLEETHRQGELLARRNIELEVLRELVGSLQGLEDEEEILQTALDLVLQRLGLTAGWVFWGEASSGELGLAAARGVAKKFVIEAREKGIGGCLCKDVFETGRLRFARNTTECPRLPDLVQGTEPMTHACIPLKFERGTLGVMNIANRPGRLFSPQELQFLETFGNQVCLAVDKTRTARAESRSNAEAKALASLARAIGGSLKEEHVLSALADYTRELLSADVCAIFLGEKPSSLLFAHLSGPPMEGLEVGRSVDLEAIGSRAFSSALNQRASMVVPNALEDPRGNPQLARRWGIGSAIIIPLLAHDRPCGLLVAGRSQPSNWSEEEMKLADALAGQAAVAIDNARLYREAQDAFLRLQQAQYGMMRAERMATVGTLASSLAHEVRNPLNSINLQLVLLARRVAKLGAQEEMAGLLETARREIARLDSLVEEFLSLSTIDRISLAAAQPEEVVREVTALLAPMARTRGIEVSEDLDGPLPPISMDREKIKQVLINVVRNAIEAMPEGGSLRLSIRRSDEMVAIDVADTGTGIAPGLDVFDFFVSTKRGGTGLGLPIARRIVEGHGGSLSYRSDPGRGTTFTIALKAR